MRPILVSFLLMVMLVACSQTLELELISQRYYVSPSGNDSNPGTWQSPFRSIQKCASVATPGTACLVRAGTYRESIRPAQSGLAGLPILFAPYKNETVLISGANLLNTWTPHTGSIVKTNVNWDLGVGKNQLFLEGQMLPEARYPNSTGLLEPWGSMIAPTGSGNSWRFQAAAVPADLAGAFINFIPGPAWVTETGSITSATANRISFRSVGGQFDESPDFNSGLFALREGNPYFVWGKLSLLDSPGEWFYENGTLYLWVPPGVNLAQQQLEFKRRPYAFDLRERSYITVRGFHVFAATITTTDPQNPANSSSERVILDGLHLRYPSHFTFIQPGTAWEAGILDSGILLYGNRHSLKNSSIAYSAGNGVALGGQGHLLENNIIHDVNYAATDSATISTGWYGLNSTDHSIRFNTLFNAGRSVLVHRNSQNLRIHHNELYNAGLLSNDLGLSYTFDSDGAGTEIAYNLLHDNFSPSESMGIYLDNGSKNFLVHHNLVWNVKAALNLNLPSLNNRIYNNTLLGWNEAVSSGAARQADCVISQTRLINNIYGAPASFGFVFDGSDCPSGSATPVQQNNLAPSINPRFVDVPLHDYRLSATSPAIDAGRLISGITTGFSGSAPDMGALEFPQVAFQAGASLLEPCIYGDVCPRAAPKKYGLLGQYYDDETLQALVYERIDPWIDFGYYDETEAIAGTFMPDGLSYSARWTGFLEVPKTATYTFYVLADDGARLWVNEQQLINRWDYADPPENQASLNLQAGQRYPIKLEMHQGAGGAVVQLEWSYPGQARAVIPYRYFSHD